MKYFRCFDRNGTKLTTLVGMDDWDWVQEGGDVDGVILEDEVVELGFEGEESTVYVGFFGLWVLGWSRYQVKLKKMQQ